MEGDPFTQFKREGEPIVAELPGGGEPRDETAVLALMDETVINRCKEADVLTNGGAVRVKPAGSYRIALHQGAAGRSGVLTVA